MLWPWVSKSEKAFVGAAFDGLALRGLCGHPFSMKSEVGVHSLCFRCRLPALQSPVSFLCYRCRVTSFQSRVPPDGPVSLHFVTCTIAKCL